MAQRTTETDAPENGAERGALFRWHPAQAGRRSLQPILHDELWKQYKTLQGLHWVPEEVDLTRDKADWARLAPREQHFVKGFLAFFSRADFDVVDLLDKIDPHVRGVHEASMYLAEQRAQEHVHAEAYDLQIQGLGLPADEISALRSAFQTNPAVAALHQWIQGWLGAEVPLGETLVADAFTEGLLFQGAFAALQWLRERNLLPGVTMYNSFIARDEGVHTLTVCALIARLGARARPTPARIHQICESAVDQAVSFVSHVVPVEAPPHPATPNTAADGRGPALIGLTRPLLVQYLKFQADCVLTAMGEPELYGVENPFPFMDQLSLNRLAKTNFFEHRHLGYRELAGASADALVFTLRDDPVSW
jgi:ribonucleotide reductase beta subunit family protein with ferritin-like domain